MFGGIAIGLVSAVLQSTAYIFSRRFVMRHKSPFKLMIYSNLLQALFSLTIIAALMPAVDFHWSLPVAVWLVAFVIFGSLGSFAFFRALRDNKPLTLPDCREILLQSGCNWDLAKAMTLALDAGDKIAGEIIVISTAKAIRLQDYLATAMEFLQSSSEITWVDADEFYKAHLEHTGLPFLRQHMCFSIDKARKLLGYEPEYTTKEGLLKALEWCRKTGLL